MMISCRTNCDVSGHRAGRTALKPAYCVFASGPISAIAPNGKRCLSPRHDCLETARSPVGARVESNRSHWSKP
jgi:hypothetical protein